MENASCDWMRSINELSMKLRGNVEWNQLEPIDSNDLIALNGRNRFVMIKTIALSE